MISLFFDLILMLLKWPVALVAVVMLPPMVSALNYMDLTNMRFATFAIGVVGYYVLKIMAAARSNISMQIIAHELTHSFFALLTFHKVTHIHLNMDDSGGAMEYKGCGNWLITIAPYFFPLFMFLFMMIITFFSKKLPDGYLVNVLFGYFFAYHVESVIVQIHPRQTDFLQVGFPFCFLFLPGANLFVCSIIMAFNNGGWNSVQKYMYVVGKMFDKVYSSYFALLTN